MHSVVTLGESSAHMLRMIAFEYLVNLIFKKLNPEISYGITTTLAAATSISLYIWSR